MANPTETTGPRLSPFCGDLRTKRWYFLDAPALTEEELLDASGRAWCKRTMQSLGPDGELVNPETCRRGRACFRSVRPEA
jgi:hypothetical protein